MVQQTTNKKTSAPATKGAFDKNEFENIRGLAMFARVTEGNVAPAYELEDGIMIAPKWEIDVLVTDLVAARLLDKGFKVRGQGREVNPKYIEFIQDNGLDAKGYSGAFVRCQKSTERKSYDKLNNVTRLDAKGQPIIEAAPAPVVRDAIGTVITDPDFMIGNGSEVTCRVSPTKKKGARSDFGARLMSVTIHEYVPYAKGTKAGSFQYGQTQSDASEDFDVENEENDYNV